MNTINKVKVLQESRKLTITEPEQYFIQFLFMENRNLLGYKYKDLYKAILDAYSDVYKVDKEAKVDLSDINKKFKAIL